jgi:hypothetical protein
LYTGDLGDLSIGIAVTCKTVTTIAPDTTAACGFTQHRDYNVSQFQFSEEEQRVASEQRLAKTALR